MDNTCTPVITVFCCTHTSTEGSPLFPDDVSGADLRIIRLACTGMLKDVFLLRAFESGSDAVVVLACPEGDCLHSEGNIRAARRVTYTRGILEQVGIDSQRLVMCNIAPGDAEAASQALRHAAAVLTDTDGGLS